MITQQMLNHVGQQQNGYGKSQRQPEFLAKPFNRMSGMFVVAGMGIMSACSSLVYPVRRMMVLMMCVMFHPDIF